uniref:Uncharacterized protein n=1 Tax=Arundo donax TaxID=35708 RepID=A0A0A9CP10_ARUDO
MDGNAHQTTPPNTLHEQPQNVTPKNSKHKCVERRWENAVAKPQLLEWPPAEPGWHGHGGVHA